MPRSGMFGRVDRETPARARQQLMDFIERSRAEWVETEVARAEMQAQDQQRLIGEQKMRAFQESLANTQSTNDIPRLWQHGLDLERIYPEMGTTIRDSIKQTSKRVTTDTPIRETVFRYDPETDTLGEYIIGIDASTGEQAWRDPLFVREHRKEERTGASDLDRIMLSVMKENPNLSETQAWQTALDMRYPQRFPEADESFSEFFEVVDGEWRFRGNTADAQRVLMEMGPLVSKFFWDLERTYKDTDPDAVVADVADTYTAQMRVLFETLGIEFPVEEVEEEKGRWWEPFRAIFTGPWLFNLLRKRLSTDEGGSQPPQETPEDETNPYLR